MAALMNVFSFSPVYSVLTVAAGTGIGFIAGFLLKSGVVAAHKKRVLELENEMLSNHSRILELEKNVGELKNENLKLKSRETSESKLKAS